jgi:hypothetical protein
MASGSLALNPAQHGQSFREMDPLAANRTP